MFRTPLSLRHSRAPFHLAASSLLLGSALALVLPAHAQPQSPQRVRYLGFDAYRLSNGRSQAVVVPALGRVMSYGLIKGKNLLWSAVPGPAKAGEWRNWGGDKSWPSPQSRWPLAIGHVWPPAPAWDGQAHAARVLPNGHLRLTSGLWPVWNCRVIRDFSFATNGEFVIAQTFEKVSGPPVELAVWDIAQVATPQAIFIPANPDSTYKKLFHWLTKPDPKGTIQPDATLVRPRLLRVRPSGTSTNKMGIDAPRSALVVVSDGIAWRQSAPHLSGNYPDGADGSGFPIEIFDIGGTGQSHYMETELLSPLKIFHAGDRFTHTVRWRLHALKNPRADSPGCASEVQAFLAWP